MKTEDAGQVTREVGYQMHASVPERSERREAGYERKLSWTMTLIFDEEGAVGGRARRERTMKDVMEG
jgi:hypothetical protein